MRRALCFIVGCAAAVAVAGCGASTQTAGGGTAPSDSASPDLPTGSAPTYDPTPYPPHNYGDLAQLAGLTADLPRVLGDDDISIGGCTKHRISILVPPSTAPEMVIGLMADEDSLGEGGAVFAFASRADFRAGNGYTAGRLIHDDPCQLDDTITVDVGGIGSSTEYTFPAH